MADLGTTQTPGRASSVSSSVTEAEAYHDPEKNALRDSEDGGYALKTPEELEQDRDEERDGLLDDEGKPAEPKKQESTTRSSFIWMVVNTLATIGIVGLAELLQHEKIILIPNG